MSPKKKTTINNESGLETINIGIFGHIDHGKTTLLEKLSGKWTDTHSEELKRGITIKLGYADTVIYKDKEEYNITKKGVPFRHVSFIDAPGHEMLMATTLSGAALIDAALLVVAANEGIKPQTREHLMTLQAKKIKNVIIIQNKIDLVSIEDAKKNYEVIKEFLPDMYKDVKVIPVSAQQEVSIAEVLKEIALLSLPQTNVKDNPVFIIARSFDINKPGTVPQELHGAVLGGSLKQGVIKVGDSIEIKPGRSSKENNQTIVTPFTTKVRSLFKGSQQVKQLTPGGSMAIETELDMALAKSDRFAGNVASHVGKLPDPTSKITLKCTLFNEVFGTGKHIKVDQIKEGEMLMININTSITGGTVHVCSKEEVEISLKIPAIVFTGDNVSIARSVEGHWRLIGYGEIIYSNGLN